MPRSSTRISFGAVPRVERLQFTRQIATLLKAGVPVARALAVSEEMRRPGLLRDTLQDVRLAVEGVASVDIGANLPKPAMAAAEVLDGAQVFVPLSGHMDVDLERKRIRKDLDKKDKALNGVKHKLQNAEFLNKAPQEVVQREEDRKDELSRQIKELQELLDSLDEG